MNNDYPFLTGFMLGFFLALLIIAFFKGAPGQMRSKFEIEAIKAGVARYVMDTNIPPAIRFEFITNKNEL